MDGNRLLAGNHEAQRKLCRVRQRLNALLQQRADLKQRPLEARRPGGAAAKRGPANTRVGPTAVPPWGAGSGGSSSMVSVEIHQASSELDDLLLKLADLPRMPHLPPLHLLAGALQVQPQGQGLLPKRPLVPLLARPLCLQRRPRAAQHSDLVSGVAQSLLQDEAAASEALDLLMGVVLGGLKFLAALPQLVLQWHADTAAASMRPCTQPLDNLNGG
mmetsp:Transcript_36313/g.117424  ORF Transcript_36313/g.117424 Transcript_36313/m.117424 type:complete len:217 (+) Transcript_36313:96-746(+)